MKLLSSTFLYILTFIYAVASFAADPNVVITNLENTYKFVPSKDGRNVEKIEINSQTTFLARRAADVATATEFYSSDVKLNKASGGDVRYGVYQRSDIFFDDSKVVQVFVDLKKPGATGKATISTTYTRPEFFNKVYLIESYDIENATLTFELPASMESRFSFEPRNIPADKLTTTTERKSGKVIHTITVKDLKDRKTFSDAPSLNISGPQIAIRGQFSDVNDLYRYLYRYIDLTDPNAAAVEAKAKEVTANCSTDHERIMAITRFVHDNIRYVAVEHGELGQRPDIPSEVLRKLYGDCKGSATLLKAMFRAVGLDARTVWIGTKEIKDNWTDFPATSCGNHMIAAVMLGDSIVFVDGTAKFTNPPNIPDGIQGQQALIEDTPEKCLTAFVPVTPPTNNNISTDFTISVNPDGHIDASGQLTASGVWNTSFHYLLYDTPKAKLSTKLSDALLKLLKGKTAEITDTAFTDTYSTIHANITNIGKIKRIGDDIYVDMNMIPNVASLKFDIKERNSDGLIDFGRAYSAKVTLIIPEGMKAVDLPAPFTLNNGYFKADVATRLSADGREIIRTMSFEIPQETIPLDKLNSFNTDLSQVIRAYSSSVQLTPIN